MKYLCYISSHHTMFNLKILKPSGNQWKRHFWGRFAGLGLLFVGVGFYLGWSLLYDTWIDVGLYSFVIVLIVFGLLELALVQEQIKKENSTS